MSGEPYDEAEIGRAIALLPPLLGGLEVLELVARYLHPNFFSRLKPLLARSADSLRTVAPSAEAAPKPFFALLSHPAEDVLQALDAASTGMDDGDIRNLFRALRHLPRAQEALYQLAAIPDISRYFTEAELRDDATLAARVAGATPSEQTGIHHFGNGREERGGFSLYVPEYYTPDENWPLVVALHGGSGHGRSFLWTWLRTARSIGAIVISPTARGETWSLRGDDIDSPNLMRMVEHVRSNYAIDPKRMLMTGLSDGGTFTYISGLESGSPFTHLAPVAAAFHPMLVAMADAGRVRDLPIRIVHGALDWMFALRMAEEANEYLRRAGARVEYVPLDDLSHCYPREQNAPILRWMTGS